MGGVSTNLHVGSDILVTPCNGRSAFLGSREQYVHYFVNMRRTDYLWMLVSQSLKLDIANRELSLQVTEYRLDYLYRVESQFSKS